jgi:hypothetical protein
MRVREFEEQIEDGDTPPEVDVEGQQGEADWRAEPRSDDGLTPAARERLGLP